MSPEQEVILKEIEQQLAARGLTARRLPSPARIKIEIGHVHLGFFEIWGLAYVYEDRVAVRLFWEDLTIKAGSGFQFADPGIFDYIESRMDEMVHTRGGIRLEPLDSLGADLRGRP